MNLISCEWCGVVLDKNHLEFPDAYEEFGNADPNAVWDGEKHVSTIECPVCKTRIMEEK